MPSSPLSSLPNGPFGAASYTLYTNTKSIWEFMRSLVKPVKKSLHSSVAPVDIGLLDNNAKNIEMALKKTTDIVAQSVRAGLRAFNPCSPTKNDARVLVFGTHGFARAKQMSQIPDFPEQFYLLSSGKPQRHGGIFWTDDALVLSETEDNSFDAVLCFNVSSSSIIETKNLINQLQRVLRPGGTLAGTGLFKGLQSAEVNHNNAAASASSLSVRTFRDLVEQSGFFMHTAIDLSLEGNVVLQVLQELNSIEHPLGFVRSGSLLCVRFLATKNAPIGACSRHKQIVAISVENSWGLEEKVPAKAKPFSFSESSSSIPMSLTPASSSSSLASSSSFSTLISSEPQDGVVVTGGSLGLPQHLYPNRKAFDPDNMNAILRGENFISNLTAHDKQEILDKNVFKVYKKNGERVKVRLTKDEEVIQLCSKLGPLDLCKEYGVPAHVTECLDSTYKYAIAAGLEALMDAGINVIQTDQKGNKVIIGLPESMRDETGVIFASSFPCLDSCVEEVSKCVAARVRAELKANSSENPDQPEYEYDRKLLFKLLVMANCQLAELIKARGPNTHVNAACASTTQAVTIAEDWIRVGRCRRVVIISSDNATSENLMPYLGTGFLALGAATTVNQVTEAAVPFDKRRKGMLLGAGAVGMVLEATSAAIGRQFKPKVEILGSHLCNSAFHACLMHGEHITAEFAVFLKKMELQYGIDRNEIAKDCIYFSHETCTSANGGCAKMELDALENSFGKQGKQDILIANTKGFTGHPMGVGLEEVVAVASLVNGVAPPIANYKCPDPCLAPVNLSDGSKHDRKYAIRFAAGFGNQFVYIMYKKWDEE